MGFTYTFKVKPYAHQVKALKKLLSTKRGGALLMQARTGKTKVAVDYSAILHKGGKVNRVLVVCPISAIDVWAEQILDNLPDEITWRLTVWDKQGRKRQELPKMGEDILDFVIVNYDGFSTAGMMKDVKTRSGEVVRRRVKRGGKYELKNKLKLWQPQLMILDESHRIKSPSAARTTTITTVAWKRNREGLHELVPYRVIMTGTPWTKRRRPFDLYSQWKFLNPHRFKGMTLQDFKHRFGRFLQLDGYEKFLGARNEDELIRMIHKDSYVITRAECYDLPDKLPDRILHAPLEESAQVYDDMAEEMVAQVHSGELTEASIRLVLDLRLKQISGGVVRTTNDDGTKGKLVVVGSEKLRMLKDVLEDLIANEEKVIIAAQFRPEIQRIVNLCKKLKVPTYEIHGGVDRRDRPNVIKAFRQEKGAAVYVAQPSAAYEAIDLREAGTTIWYSLTSSWVIWDQFNDRNALHPNARQMIYIIGGPIDQIQYDSLQEDDDIGKRVLQNPELILRDGATG